MKRDPRDRAFSLTELLVVVAVILILVSVLVVGTEAIYANAMQTKCQHRLEQIGAACTMYANANDGALPPASDFAAGKPWYQLLAEGGHLPTLEVVACPSAEAPPPEVVQPEPPGEVSASILETLRWLKQMQNPDGGWTCEGSKKAHNAVSGFAMLVFVLSGCTDMRPPEFSETVKKGIEYIISQNDNGSFRRGSAEHMYTQGIMTMAACEAARRMERPSLQQAVRGAAQDGVNYICSKQSDVYGGFTYGGPGQDMSVTGWNIQAIRAGINAGLDIPASSQYGGSKTQLFLEKSIFTGGVRCVSGLFYCWQSNCNWVGPDPGTRDCYRNTCTWKGTVGELVNGKCPVCNYTTYAICPSCGLGTGKKCDWGGLPSECVNGKCKVCGGAVESYADDFGTCYQYTSLPWSTTRSVRLTAAALASRRLMNQSVSSTACQGQMQWLADHNYEKYATSSISDVYTVYYLTLAIEYMGGARWTQWQAGFQPSLMAKQILDGGASHGAYPVSFSYGSHGGQILTTCLAALALGHMVPHTWAQEMVVGKCTYGYNNQVGLDRRRPAVDTIMVMDYSHWAIDRDELSPEFNDDDSDIALRHSGRANALFGDGSVRALALEEIRDGMWTLGPAD